VRTQGGRINASNKVVWALGGSQEKGGTNGLYKRKEEGDKEIKKGTQMTERCMVRKRGKTE
jgi:hypothetical protein